MKVRFPLFPMLMIGYSLLLASNGSAQDFLSRWQARVNATQAEQPHWVTPLVTVTPRLEQEVRADFLRQIAPKLTDTWNLGGGKGLELIPTRHIELIANMPAYIQHNTKAKDGFGDTTFLLKYRFLASNEQHRNYILTAFMGASIPTGSYSNGSTDATVTPTLAGGWGRRKFDVQSTIGAQLPLENTATLGRPVTWNTALQFKTGFAFPEVEFNATYYNGGPNDGKKQNFCTPGIVARFPLHQRLKLVLGGGMQIATSTFHTYNHELVFTARLPF